MIGGDTGGVEVGVRVGVGVGVGIVVGYGAQEPSTRTAAIKQLKISHIISLFIFPFTLYTSSLRGR